MKVDPDLICRAEGNDPTAKCRQWCGMNYCKPAPEETKSVQCCMPNESAIEGFCYYAETRQEWHRCWDRCEKQSAPSAKVASTDIEQGAFRHAYDHDLSKAFPSATQESGAMKLLERCLPELSGGSWAHITNGPCGCKKCLRAEVAAFLNKSAATDGTAKCHVCDQPVRDSDEWEYLPGIGKHHLHCR